MTDQDHGVHGVGGECCRADPVPGRGCVMLGWLFRRPLDRAAAVAAAARFLEANGCRVRTDDRDDPGDAIPVRLHGAALVGTRWHVVFQRFMPPGVWTSHPLVEVWVHSHTGVAEF